MEKLDDLRMAWHNREELVFVKAEALRVEALSHGIGEPAALGRVDHSGPLSFRSWPSCRAAPPRPGSHHGPGASPLEMLLLQTRTTLAGRLR